MSTEILLIRQWKILFADHEKSVDYFYGDSVGVVTIGVGHAIKNFAKDMPSGLNWTINDKTATSSDIEKAYTAVKSRAERHFSQCTQGANAKNLTGSARAKHINGCMPTAESYKKLNQGLKLNKTSIATLLESDLRLKLFELKHEFRRLAQMIFEPRFRELEEYPFPAQVALLDMAYNLGAKGLTGASLGGARNRNGYPNMLHAIREGNFEAAAQASNRSQVGDHDHPRNEAVFDLLMDAATEIGSFNGFILPRPHLFDQFGLP